MSPAHILQQHEADADSDTESVNILEMERWNPSLTNRPPGAPIVAQTADSMYASKGVRGEIPLDHMNTNSDDGDDDVWVRWGVDYPLHGGKRREEAVANWLETQAPSTMKAPQYCDLRVREPGLHSHQHYPTENTKKIRRRGRCDVLALYQTTTRGRRCCRHGTPMRLTRSRARILSAQSMTLG